MRPQVDDFEAWVAARGPGLLRLAFVLTGDPAEAEDVVQEALSRALPRWSRIAEMEFPEAYVRRMVVNAHTSRWRRFRRRETPVADPMPVDTVARGADPDDRDRVWRACLALPESQQVAVVLRFFEDLTYAEIAQVTGAREGTVRVRVSRGLAALRRELGGVADVAEAAAQGDQHD
ncbi:MAG: SigE family RNA polymerase sigma factor [Nocardioides sp.]